MSLDRKKLVSLIERAGADAARADHNILVSYAERLDSIDPLSALEAISSSANDGIRAEAAGGRAYWSRPIDNFTIAGIGAVVKFECSGPRRFRVVNDLWSRTANGAIIDAPGRGTGPLAIGGFSFEPDKAESAEWAGFPDAHLILPRMLFFSNGDESFVTVNLLVGRDAAPDVDLEVLDRMLDLAVADDYATAQNEATRATDIGISGLESSRSWHSTVSKAINAIRNQDFDKVVIARAVAAEAERDYDVFALLRSLHSMHRESFVFAYWRGSRVFAGASPERLVRLDGRDVEASSLAGTIARGSTPAEDVLNAKTLQESGKDRAEHAAVKNALRAALAEECDDVRCSEEPSLLTLPHVHHLHTELRGRLKEGRSILDLVGRLHPTPAVGGFPREAALDFIRHNERLDRGWYAAPIGWFDSSGGEFAVALRSSLIDGDQAILFAGCGIVAESDPELEFKESSLKLQVMESALADATLPADVNSLAMTPAERSA